MIALNRINLSQALIFTGSTLFLSLVANLFLYSSNANSVKQVNELTSELEAVQSELEANQRDKNVQLSRLDKMGGQQTELADIIRQLQTELNRLDEQQKATAATAQQSQEKLQNARAQIAELDNSLREKNRQLEQAQVTINNQLRALRRLQSSNSEKAEDTLTSEIASRLTQDHPKLSVTESANGSTLINIPLDLIFANTELEYSDQAENLLQDLADALKLAPQAQIQVIGHSDARPIVSDLSRIYPTNWELSSARASKVTTFLIDQGIAAERLLASGKAANQPVRDDVSEAAWALNRRIEIQVRP